MIKNQSLFSSIVILSKYRDRVCEGVYHDVRQRFTGSALGLMWVVLFPLLQLGIYAGLYSVVFKIRVPNLSEFGYVILIFSGLVPLMAFNEAITAATTSLSANKSLLMNSVFPAELIPLRAAISGHITSVIGLMLTVLFGLLMGATNYQAIFLVPVFWIFLLMFAIGIGWILSLLTLVARDIQHGLGLITMMMFVLSPFAYTPEMVPESLKVIIYLNPMSYFVLTFQKLICYGTWPDIIPAIGSVVLGIGTFVSGFIVFERTKHIFFDYA